MNFFMQKFMFTLSERACVCSAVKLYTGNRICVCVFLIRGKSLPSRNSFRLVGREKMFNLVRLGDMCGDGGVAIVGVVAE